MTAHEYGPHRPEDAPAYVTVGRMKGWEGEPEVDVPISEAVLNQRRRINELAHAAATSTAGTERVAAVREALAARDGQPEEAMG